MCCKKKKPCCEKVKEIVKNYQQSKNWTEILKFLAIYNPVFTFELYYLLQDYPELYQALYFNKDMFLYFRLIFYGRYKLYTIEQQKVEVEWFIPSMPTATYTH